VDSQHWYSRIGLFGETCIIGEMTILAAELSKAGIGDYWEDVDQYVRNHLAEMQVLDANALQAIVTRCLIRVAIRE